MNHTRLFECVDLSSRSTAGTYSNYNSLYLVVMKNSEAGFIFFQKIEGILVLYSTVIVLSGTGCPEVTDYNASRGYRNPDVIYQD